MYSKDPAKLFDISKEKYKSGDIMGAIDTLNEMEKLVSDDEFLFYYRGLFNAELMNFENALEDFTKAIELDPEYADAWLERGVVNKILNNSDDASLDFDAALALDPNNSRAIYYKSLMRNIDGEHAEALILIEKAIELNPGNIEYIDARAKIFIEMKRYQDAYDDFNFVVENSPDNAEAIFNRGSICQSIALDLLEKAKADFDKASKLDPVLFSELNSDKNIETSETTDIEIPDDHDDIIKTAHGLIMTGNHEKALLMLAKSLEKFPDSHDIYFYIAGAYEVQGNYPEAVKNYSHALYNNENFLEAYYHRALLYDLLGDYESAAEDYTMFMKIEGDNPEAYCNRGNDYTMLGKIDKAIEDLKKAIDLKPEFPSAYNNLGNAYYLKNEYSKAIEFYTKALEYDESFYQAISNRALSYISLSERENLDNTDSLLEEALKDSLKAVAISKRQNGVYNLACIYALVRDYENALSTLDEALAKGQVDVKFVLKDKEWLPLENNERFIKIIDKYEKRWIEK